MKVVIDGFVNTMSKPQRTAGFVYLPFHIFLIPLFVEMLAHYLPNGLDDIAANIIYYGMGFSFCLICMWRYLRGAYDVLIDNLVKNIVAFIFSYVIFILLSYIAAGAVFAILGDSVLNPNNDAVKAMANESPRAVWGLTVFLAPVVEETLFRGVLFGSVQPKNRTLAYILSIAAFGFYHEWQYALAFMDWKILIYMLQYVPAGYALAWLYEKTNCIWMPVFLHMTVNLITMTIMV
ncbi:MAG: CPBP family intramembrane metalloprotease [Clostridiales bacterium]|jgi:membrane protease YdiL (CAAX protease family)|nr:CPBP family intramembrane metalloprotease [Clostridiales bacterium]